jgi:hypothetical protein
MFAVPVLPEQPAVRKRSLGGHAVHHDRRGRLLVRQPPTVLSHYNACLLTVQLLNFRRIMNIEKLRPKFIGSTNSAGNRRLQTRRETEGYKHVPSYESQPTAVVNT